MVCSKAGDVGTNRTGIDMSFESRSE